MALALAALAEWLEAWGLFGYGMGMMSLTEDASVRTDISMLMGATGVRGILLAPVANGGFGVAVRSDGRRARPWHHPERVPALAAKG